MATTGGELTTSGLCAAMRFDHERLEIGARHLLECVLYGRADVVERAFLRFRAEMMAHLEAERRYLLPAFEAERPDSAKRIRDDHVLIHALIATIGEQIARRSVMPAIVRKLVDALHANGQREIAELYPWAEGGVGIEESRAALELIHQAETDRKHQKWMP